MQGEIQVSFDGMPVSDAIEAACLAEAEELERFHPRMTSCRVVISQPNRHHRKGRHFEVRIEARLPGAVVAVTREPPAHAADEDIHLALREAFDKARRQIEDHARVARGDVKTHVPAPRGRVSKLMHESGYGFIETADGDELYFHRNSVLGDAFDRLAIGAEVRFTPEQGDKGPQASSVRLVGTRAPAG